MSLVEHRAFLPFCAVLAAGLALFMALGPLDGHVHVVDELGYLLQARLFGHGLRAGPPSAWPQLEQAGFWVGAPNSYSVFPIGWPLLLAPFARLGLEDLANPLLAAALPLLGWLALRERLDEREARWAALFLALTPGVTALAASKMSQTSVLVALVGALAVVLRARDAGWAWALAGLGLGYVVLARPFDGVLLAAPLGLWGLFRAPSHRDRALLVAAMPLAAALTLLDNQALTGGALDFPATQWLEAESGRPGCNRLGFGEDVGCRPTIDGFGHTLDKALRAAGTSLERLDRLVLGLPGGGLVALLGVALARRRLLWLLPALLLPLCGYLLYWSPGAAYGARFLHPAQLLLAAGAGVLLARFRWAALLWIPLGLVGQGLLALDLQGYWCVRLPSEIHAVDRGLLLVRQQGTAEVWSPTLRLALSCNPDMAFIGPRGLHDPTRSGLIVARYPEEREAFVGMVEQSPGPVYALQQDLGTGAGELTRLK